MVPINSLGLGISKVGTSYGALSAYVLCCFFVSTATELTPQETIADTCDTWDLDGNGDIMPEDPPDLGGCWEIDSNDDIMPEGV